MIVLLKRIQEEEEEEGVTRNFDKKKITKEKKNIPGEKRTLEME